MLKKSAVPEAFCKTCGHAVYNMETHVQTEEHKRSARKTKIVGRHIIGQCNTADFRLLEHLSDMMSRGKEVDLTNLSNKQKMAVHVLHHFQKNDIPFEVLLKIREVIIWSMNSGIAYEYKLLDPRDKETRNILKSMRAIW